MIFAQTVDCKENVINLSLLSYLNALLHVEVPGFKLSYLALC